MSRSPDAAAIATEAEADDEELVAALRHRLWGMAYRPVAVYGPGASVGSPGKQPVGGGWQHRARCNPPAAVTEPVSLSALNTGILCDGLRALDLDIEDSNIIRQLRDLAIRTLGTAPIRQRVNSPRLLLLYRAVEGEPKKRVIVGTTGKVEVLGRGQQFVAYGIHPSGASLTWVPDGLDALPLKNLAPLSETNIDKFLARVARLIGSPEVPRVRRRCLAPPNVHAFAPLIRFVAGAPGGERNDRLFWAGCRTGEMIRAGLIKNSTRCASLLNTHSTTGNDAI